MARIGVDVGGTNTDLVLETDGGVFYHKVPTTPEKSVNRRCGRRSRDLRTGRDRHLCGRDHRAWHDDRDQHHHRT
ncbi:hydantoinase/oxoprolinase N-terminal domain-containing protein [uncultured Paracoccus sp.]|uniref:hydantoinase/oxoprolinase N-terminal domain-containing protein n=1 Tax=uncultured Paracoccus sp. TaxID=189685 RepID=UPI002637C6A4|nr:hydantoinase/oxoprolinase N-terminal domain-containing protein [uncultured Paracoccus sp.]